MSKIILEAFKTERSGSLIRNIIKIRDIVYIKSIDGIPYLFINNRKLNKYTQNDTTIYTTNKPEDYPELNIHAVELIIIE